MLMPHAQYHVVARANRQEFILETAKMKELFLAVVKRAKRKFKFQICNFCIMDNHIHLMITPLGGENLSKIMQWILSVFAIQYNKANGYKGHVWYDRFKSKIVDGLRQFLDTFLYVANNPIKPGLCNKPDEYEYCGVFHMRCMRYEVVQPPSLILLLNFPALFSPELIAE